MKTFTYIIALIASIAILSGCEKEGQTIGTTGPQGPAGAANLYTFTDTIDSLQWINYNTTGWKAVLDMPEISQDILDNGVVFVYIYAPNSDNVYGWVMLPAPNPATLIGTWGYIYYLNTVEINVVNNINPLYAPGTEIFKIVVMRH